MWQLSTRFCRPPYCNNPKAPYDHCMFSCPDTRMKRYESELRNDCEKSKGVAIKSIRYHDLIHLEPLLEEAKFDFKIIVLTRDPRAIYASRTEIYSDENYRWQLMADLQQECRDTYSRLVVVHTIAPMAFQASPFYRALGATVLRTTVGHSKKSHLK